MLSASGQSSMRKSFSLSKKVRMYEMAQLAKQPMEWIANAKMKAIDRDSDDSREREKVKKVPSKARIARRQLLE